MNDQIKTTFKENNVSDELLDDIEKYYPDYFMEFICDIVEFEDAVKFYEKYKKLDVFDLLYDLACYVDDFYDLCSNHTFVNKLYSLVNELIRNKIDLKDDRHDLDDVKRILLMNYGNVIDR